MSRTVSPIEMEWLRTLLNVPFQGQTQLQSQLPYLTVVEEVWSPYIALKFASSGGESFPSAVRVPVDMIAWQNHHAPVQFLLHINNGTIDELEIIALDGSVVDWEHISLDQLEYGVAEEVKIRMKPM
ncbi:MAG: hypothetical protein Q4A10_01490 [Aerococcaceae bacterium]|nr:hypothetical protein [Aerococcaceae bacterium]